MKKADHKPKLDGKKSSESVNQAATNDAYDKALSGSQKSSAIHNNSARKNQERQQERRIKHQNLSQKQRRRIRQSKNNSENEHYIHLHHEENEDSGDEEKYSLINSEFSHQHNHKNPEKEEDNEHDTDIKDSNLDDKHFLDNGSQQAQKRTSPSYSQNTAHYMSLLKNFCNEKQDNEDEAFQSQKAMAQETIIHMFDQFKLGFESFPKSSKNHHVFGQGLHLCQKIIVAFNQNNIPEAKQLIQRLLPQRLKEKK